jgi:hypothetical protein
LKYLLNNPGFVPITVVRASNDNRDQILHERGIRTAIAFTSGATDQGGGENQGRVDEAILMALAEEPFAPARGIALKTLIRRRTA